MGRLLVVEEDEEELLGDFLRLVKKKAVRLLDVVPLLLDSWTAGKKVHPGIDPLCSIVRRRVRLLEAVSRPMDLQMEGMKVIATAAALPVAKRVVSETAS